MGLQFHQNIEKLQQMDIELKALLQSCKENNMSNEEIQKLFQPLIKPINKAIFIKRIKQILLVIFLITILYGLTYIESVSWHLSAIGRIAMIKILPFWDWRYLKNEKCLITNPLRNYQMEDIKNIDCSFCESINKIFITDTNDPDIIQELYLEIDVPVILTNSIDSWPNVDNNEDLIDLLQDRNYSRYYPCMLSSNVYTGNGDLNKALGRLKNFEKYFMHFQNCDFQSVKQFRKFAPRPAFLKRELSPVQYSWVLLSKNYNVRKYKKINLVDRVTVVYQVLGSNLFKLKPIKDCSEDCLDLEFELKTGEALVLSSVWNLEYLPSVQESATFILELH